MPSRETIEVELASDSEDNKSSDSDSESSGSGSDSKSEAGSVQSKRSSRSASSLRSNHSNQSDRSAERSSPARSAHSGSHSGSDEDEVGGRKLVLDERQSRSRSKSQSRSKSRSKSRSHSRSSSNSSNSSAASNNSDEEKEEAKDAPSPSENKKKRKHLVLSDDSQSGSDNDRKEVKTEDMGGATAEALFGEAGDITSESDDDGDGDGDKKPKKKQPSPEKDKSRDGDSDRESVGDMKDLDDESERKDNDKEKEQEEVVPETRIEHEIPYIRADVGKEFHFVKLPNFLSVEPRPYDPHTYEDEIDEEETQDEEGRARLKLKVENTIRWRTSFDKEGNAYKESNARMVRWSDGSLSLYLGSEVFDVYRQPLQGDHNHLFIRQGTGLQGQAVFRTKLTFRPHSTDSFTHRKMTLSLADRSQKTSSIKILGTVGADPEAHRGEMIKKEEERLRASMRRESKQKRIRERTATGRSLSGSYLEPDRGGYDDSEEEGAISLSAIKNKYKKGGPRDHRPPIYSSEEDASDIEDRKAKKLERAKALRDSDEEDDEDGGATSSKARDNSDSDDESD